jgi:hypothetical protein
MSYVAVAQVKKLQALLKDGLPGLGYLTQNLLGSFLGETSDTGYVTLYVDYTSATPTSGDQQAFVQLIPVNTAAPMQASALSYSAGNLLASSWECMIIMEQVNPALPMGPQAQFFQDIIHLMRGNQGENVELKVTAYGTLATLAGVNGAGTTTNVPAASLFLRVSNRGFPGGGS